MASSALITKALQDAQRIARTDTASAAQLQDGLDRLNDIINLRQTQGLKLFLEAEQIVTLTSGKQTYSLMPGGDVNIAKPLQIKQATYWDSSSNSRPLLPMSREEWTRLSNRTQTGSVNQFFTEKLYDRLNLYLWMVPDATAATGSVHAILRFQPTSPILSTDSVLFPPEWAIAFRWALACEFAIGMPDAVLQRCQQYAESYWAALEAWDVEDVETYFQPDARGMNLGTSKFR